MLSGKWQPFCLSLSVLIEASLVDKENKVTPVPKDNYSQEYRFSMKDG